LRFRGRPYVTGSPAWHEFSLLGHEIAIATARLKGGQAHPALRGDRGRPRRGRPRSHHSAQLLQNVGHGDFGVYAEVAAGGKIAPGDAIIPRHKTAGAVAGP
jgi:hypothetical protein